MKHRQWWTKAAFGLFLALLTWLAQDHVFFWDTVQFAGKHGLWFYGQHFRHWLLPADMDSGHPPVFGWYLALIWQLFGKSLSVSHWAMFPFLLGIVWQLFRLGQLLLQRIPVYWLVLIVLADPLFLGQSVLVSPDVVLLFLFLWALNSLLGEKRYSLAIACLGLAMISLRGMMVVAALGCFELWQHWSVRRKTSHFRELRGLAAYLPAAVFSLVFLLVHYRETGWIGYHADSPWAPSFQPVGLAGLLRNLVLFAWRWLDFGRIFVWLAVIFLAVKTNFLRTVDKSSPAGKLAIIFPILGVLLAISFLRYSGLQAHRYLWPAFLTFHCFCLILADRLEQDGLRQSILVLVFAGLLSGNLWMYPDRIAQGWDATLAHWPYYSLRQQALDYLEAERIPLDEVGTAFPDIGALQYRDLSERTDGLRAKDLQQDRWILYSNIMNDFTDEQIDQLQQHWIEQKRWQSWRVKMILYKRPTE